MNRTFHILVHGRVQGVGYRAWIHHQAELHGLSGWVRNRQDGTVEAVFQGPDHLVEAVLKACREGPRGAVVERIEPVEGDRAEKGAFDGFEVRDTV